MIAAAALLAGLSSAAGAQSPPAPSVQQRFDAATAALFGRQHPFPDMDPRVAGREYLVFQITLYLMGDIVALERAFK